ncbi:glycosyltransferase [Candidatus Microgenomates bacterium]|nr:MAG: glycosyltransferase [Candidatus Microgenomates bacterium]
MDKPFFSIIIPTLNEETFLPRLLKDLVAQKEKSFEVIIVDCGSEDRTVIKAEEFKEKIPLNILTSKIKNVSAQRNAGADNAKGMYLVFYDADVQIPKNYLSEIKKYLITHASPFLTTHIKGDSDHVYDDAIINLLNITGDWSIVIDRPFVGGYNFIVLKSVFTMIGGFDPKVVHAEDYDLSVRLQHAGYRLTILKEPKLIFSLRRFRHDGRLSVLRKNSMASLHVLTQGSIKKDLFSYPMGGMRYQLKKKDQIQEDVLDRIEKRMKQFLHLFLET